MLSDVPRAIDSLQPTADSLFDKLGRAVLSKLDAQVDAFEGYKAQLTKLGFDLGALMLAGEPPAGLPEPSPEVAALIDHDYVHFPTDEQLAPWEPEFGSDPRYWQLRHVALSQLRIGQSNRTLSEVASYGPLLEAWRRGTNDAVTCDELCGLCRYGQPDYAQQAVKFEEMYRQRQAAQPRSPRDLEQTAQPRMADYEAVSREVREQLDGAGLTEERLRLAAIESAPDLAWPRLELARLRVKQERPDEALEQLGLASQLAPGWHVAFPQTILQAGMWTGTPPGGQLLCGALHLPCARLNNLGKYALWWQKVVYALRRHCRTTGQRQFLPALRQCAALLHVAPYVSFFDVNTGIILWMKFAESAAKTAGERGNASLSSELETLHQGLRRAFFADEEGDWRTPPTRLEHEDLAGPPSHAQEVAKYRALLVDHWQTDVARCANAQTEQLPLLQQFLTHPAFVEWWDNPVPA